MKGLPNKAGFVNEGLSTTISQHLGKNDADARKTVYETFVECLRRASGKGVNKTEVDLMTCVYDEKRQQFDDLNVAIVSVSNDVSFVLRIEAGIVRSVTASVTSAKATSTLTKLFANVQEALNDMQATKISL